MKNAFASLAAVLFIFTSCSKQAVPAPHAENAGLSASELSSALLDSTHNDDSILVSVTGTSRNVSVSKQVFNANETVTVNLLQDSLGGSTVKVNWKVVRTDSSLADSSSNGYVLTVPNKNSSYAYLQINKAGTYRLTVRSFGRDSSGAIIPRQKGFANFNAN